MTSYDDNQESAGNSYCWYASANGHDSFNSSATLHVYPSGMNGHQAQLWGSTAPLQVYNVRNIDWNSMPIETPATIGYDVGQNLGYAPAAHFPTQHLQGNVSRQFIPFHGPTTQPTASASSWTSFGQSRPRRGSLPSAQESGSQNSRMAPTDGHRVLDRSEVFQLTILGADNPMFTDPSPFEDGLVPRRQDPRFDGDEYAAKWIRGDGFERAGWCSRCSSWHKLKDSAYWYHMHYAHGISCMTGRPFDLPVSWRSTRGSIGYEALCGTCEQWIAVGRGGRWRTPYFRHAYKCQAKNNSSLQRACSRSKGGNPRKQAIKPSKTH